MPMPRKVRCKWCDRHVTVVGELSARKVCGECSESRITEAIYQLRARRGPIFDRYRAGLADYVVNLYRGDIPSTPAMLDVERDELQSPDATLVLPSR